MLIADILHSCSNERIADAAVASIGGDFALRVRRAAASGEVSVGALTGSLVRRFVLEANERDWRLVTKAIGGSDVPVLCGLRVIVEQMLPRWAGPSDDAAPPSPVNSAVPWAGRRDRTEARV